MRRSQPTSCTQSTPLRMERERDGGGFCVLARAICAGMRHERAPAVCARSASGFAPPLPSYLLLVSPRGALAATRVAAVAWCRGQDRQVAGARRARALARHFPLRFGSFGVRVGRVVVCPRAERVCRVRCAPALPGVSQQDWSAWSARWPLRAALSTEHTDSSLVTARKTFGWFMAGCD